MTLPGPLSALAASLTRRGYVLADSPRAVSSGDRFVRFVQGDMSVRLARAECEWFIDLSCRAWGGGWYDAALVRPAIEHLPVSDAIPLDVQAAWVEANLDDLLSQTVDARALKMQLVRLTEVQAHQRFGV